MSPRTSAFLRSPPAVPALAVSTRTAAVALLLALAVVACGGGEERSEEERQPSSSPLASETRPGSSRAGSEATAPAAGDERRTGGGENGEHLSSPDGPVTGSPSGSAPPAERASARGSDPSDFAAAAGTPDASESGAPSPAPAETIEKGTASPGSSSPGARSGGPEETRRADRPAAETALGGGLGGSARPGDSDPPGKTPGDRPGPGGVSGPAPDGASGTYVDFGQSDAGASGAQGEASAGTSPGAGPERGPSEDGPSEPSTSESGDYESDPSDTGPDREGASSGDPTGEQGRDLADGDRRDDPTDPPDSGDGPSGTGPASVMLQPEPANVAPGGVIQLWVSIRGGVDVRGVPFHVWYDPRRVTFQGAREGAFLASAGNTTFMTSASDATGRLMVGYSLLGSGKGVSGQGTLCVLTFQALAPGTASFTFSNASVRSTTQGVQQASFVPATVQIR